ncbi:hypothetical protein ILT44_15815 [Microvirga sp. BT689]|uniref:hypothetical protein n=1 Tax=Microvirga arvi TaxID=2778731 RepID=UPI001951A17E|nr:hypothetical protein [Microvirga arvi]MBM6581664.1 hypothetical protein [Microvirga arvi]
MAQSPPVGSNAFGTANATFLSAKARCAIPVRNAAVRDFLVVASLDPAVLTLAPAEPVAIRIENQILAHRPDVVVQYEDRTCAIDIYPPVQIRVRQAWFDGVRASHADLGLPYELREAPGAPLAPLVLNARTVWGCRNHHVSAPEQVRILQHLKEAGVASLIEVAAVVRGCDGVAAVLALACRNLVELDLSLAPLGPETPVRRRRTEP